MKILVWGVNEIFKGFLGRIPEERLSITAFIDEIAHPNDQFLNKTIMRPEDALKILQPTDYDFLFIFSEKHQVYRDIAILMGFPEEKIAAQSAFRLLDYLPLLTDEQFKIIASNHNWYYHFEILPGIMTPGNAPYKSWLLDFPFMNDLKNKKCLDIGAFDGPFSLDMSIRGAQVIAFNNKRPNETGFNAMKQLTNCNCIHVCDKISNLKKYNKYKYDVIIYFNTYHEIKNPLYFFIISNQLLANGGKFIFECSFKECNFFYTYGLNLIDKNNNNNIELFNYIKTMLKRCAFSIDYCETYDNHERCYIVCTKL